MDLMGFVFTKDYLPPFINAIKYSEQLIVLKLRQCGLTESAIPLVHNLPRFLKEIDFSDNKLLGPKFGEAVANDIIGRRDIQGSGTSKIEEQYFRDLKKVVIENCQIGDTGGSLIFQRLYERERDLKTLNLCNNGMTSLSVDNLSELIEKNTNLSVLLLH